MINKYALVLLLIEFAHQFAEAKENESLGEKLDRQCGKLSDDYPDMNILVDKIIKIVKEE